MTTNRGETSEHTPKMDAGAVDMDFLATFDPELRFRKVRAYTAKFIFAMCFLLSAFEIYTAGFGTLTELIHRCFYFSIVLPMIFFLYPIRRKKPGTPLNILFDAIYSLLGGAVVGIMLRGGFNFSEQAAFIFFVLSASTFFYLKIRELLGHPLIALLDVVVCSAGLAATISFIQSMWAEPAFFMAGMTLPLGILTALTLGGIIFILAGTMVHRIILLSRGRPLILHPESIPYYDVVFAILAASFSLYLIVDFDALVFRFGRPLNRDLIMGLLSILLVLEGARRSIGPGLPFISLIAIAITYYGPNLLGIPGLDLLSHSGFSIRRIIGHMYFGAEGLYGIPLGVIATFVFHFILFGLFVSKSGLGQLFIDLAMALAGGTVGGPAKVAVVASAMFGSISGSSVANTVTTGAFTIPMMKGIGFKPRFAGAVEASASTGGQITPPIMGAAAFVMSEFLGIPYIKICIAAVIPALIHFFAIGFQVHLEALKMGILGLPREALPRIMPLLKDRGLLLLPLIVIVLLLLIGRSPFLAAFWAIVYSISTAQARGRTIPLLVTVLLTLPVITRYEDANPLAQFSTYTVVWFAVMVAGFLWTYKKSDRLTWSLAVGTTIMLIAALAWDISPHFSSIIGNFSVIAVGIFYRESRMRVPQILESMEWGARNSLAVGAACAAVGFIVGAATLSGLGLKLASILIIWAEDMADIVLALDFLHLFSLNQLALFFTLCLTAVTSIILGMGLPTTPQYIVTSMIAAPALLKWNIHPLISHMFVFFYGVLADVTPPVCLAAFAAASISGASPVTTGFTSFHLSMGRVLVAFYFVYAPVVLLMPWLLDPSAGFSFILLGSVLLTLCLSICAMSAGVVGYLGHNLGWFERALLLAAALGLLNLEIYSSIFGGAILISIYVIKKRQKQSIEKRK